jgi:hypothetical protein
MTWGRKKHDWCRPGTVEQGRPEMGGTSGAGSTGVVGGRDGLGANRGVLSEYLPESTRASALDQSM